MIDRLFDTPEKRARLIRYAWLISLVMLVLGYALMAIFWDA
ncbi:MAG TPA: hypothetical protein VLH13_00380 [Methanomassiliicoccales archaeon]|nr:hypothetical protein [Methanomassiliicoccales archaeon]